MPVYTFSEKSEESQGGVQKRGFEIGLSEDDARGGAVLGLHRRRGSSFSHGKGESIRTRAVLVGQSGAAYYRTRGFDLRVRGLSPCACTGRQPVGGERGGAISIDKESICITEYLL